MSADDLPEQRDVAEPERAVGERRVNPELRSGVEDMLASIRAAASQAEWTDEERARHEASMARIMELVREHALARGRHR